MIIETENSVEQPPEMIFGTIYLSNIIPNFVIGSFSVMLWVIASYFEHVSEAVKTLLQDAVRVASVRGIGQMEHTKELVRLRFIHEDLCDSVRHFQKAFGSQVLSACLYHMNTVLIPSRGLLIIRLMIYITDFVCFWLNNVSIYCWTVWRLPKYRWTCS